MPKRPRASKKPSAESIEALETFALALERGRFIDYISQLTNTRTLLWKNFLIGLTRGFGAVIGATVVIALLVGLLSWLGSSLPGEFGDFFDDTSKKIQQIPE